MEAKANMDVAQRNAEDLTSTDTLSVTDKVLGTVELLEAILLECDIVDLLCSIQRVCKTWNDVITSSVRIQQKL